MPTEERSIKRNVALIEEHKDAKGPGRFDLNQFPMAASYVEQLLGVQGNADEECGTVEYGPGHFALFTFDLEQQADIRMLGWCADVDAAPESMPVAAICCTDDRGSVRVIFYDSEDSAQADFALWQAEYTRLDEQALEEVAKVTFAAHDPEPGIWGVSIAGKQRVEIIYEEGDQAVTMTVRDVTGEELRGWHIDTVNGAMTEAGPDDDEFTVEEFMLDMQDLLSKWEAIENDAYWDEDVETSGIHIAINDLRERLG